MEAQQRLMGIDTNKKPKKKTKKKTLGKIQAFGRGSPRSDRPKRGSSNDVSGASMLKRQLNAFLSEGASAPLVRVTSHRWSIRDPDRWGQHAVFSCARSINLQAFKGGAVGFVYFLVDMGCPFSRIRVAFGGTQRKCMPSGPGSRAPAKARRRNCESCRQVVASRWVLFGHHPKSPTNL